MRADPILLSVISDLFVNLAAGWFGAVFILPLTAKIPKSKRWVLSLDVVFGMISLLVAYILRRTT